MWRSPASAPPPPSSAPPRVAPARLPALPSFLPFPHFYPAAPAFPLCDGGCLFGGRVSARVMAAARQRRKRRQLLAGREWDHGSPSPRGWGGERDEKRGELGAPALCLRAAAGGLCRPRGENGREAEGTGGGSAARSVPPGLQRGPEAANPPRGRDERPVSALPPPPRVMAVRSLPAPSRNSSPGVIEPRGPRRSGVRKMCTCFWRHFCIFFVC